MAMGNALGKVKSDPVPPKSQKPRTFYKNPYINYYVRLFDSDQFRGKRVTEVAQYAGQTWRKMGEEEKRCYRDMAARAPSKTKPAALGGRRSSRLSKRESCNAVNNRIAVDENNNAVNNEDNVENVEVHRIASSSGSETSLCVPCAPAGTVRQSIYRLVYSSSSSDSSPSASETSLRLCSSVESLNVQDNVCVNVENVSQRNDGETRRNHIHEDASITQGNACQPRNVCETQDNMHQENVCKTRHGLGKESVSQQRSSQHDMSQKTSDDSDGVSQNTGTTEEDNSSVCSFESQHTQTEHRVPASVSTTSVQTEDTQSATCYQTSFADSEEQTDQSKARTSVPRSKTRSIFSPVSESESSFELPAIISQRRRAQITPERPKTRRADETAARQNRITTKRKRQPEPTTLRAPKRRRIQDDIERCSVDSVETTRGDRRIASLKERTRNIGPQCTLPLFAAPVNFKLPPRRAKMAAIRQISTKTAKAQSCGPDVRRKRPTSVKRKRDFTSDSESEDVCQPRSRVRR